MSAHASFAVSPGLADCVRYVLYDADSDCIDDVADVRSSNNTKVFPYCVLDKKGKTSFNINFDTFSSSIYQLNSEFRAYCFPAHDKTDNVLGHSVKPVRRVQIETQPLDHLVEEKKVPAPDFLSLSCTGSELLALKGAIESLDQTVVGVFTRVHFVEKWQGGALFGDIDKFLRNKGYLLCSIKPNYVNSRRVPVYARASGIPMTGDAIYLLNPAACKTCKPSITPERLKKLAFVAALIGRFDIVADVLNLVEDQGARFDLTSKQDKVLADIAEFLQSNCDLPELWHEKYNFDEVVALSKFTNIGGEQSRSRSMKTKLKNLARNLLVKMGLKINIIPQDSAFQKMLRRHGLDYSADMLNR